jgi:hypothetical protein
MRAQARFVNHRSGVAATLKAALSTGTDTMAWSRETLVAAAGALVDAGRAAGTIRPDVQPFDLLRLGHGLVVASGYGDPEHAERMMTVLLAGLAVRP